MRWQGRDGFQRMLRERKQLVPYMREQLTLVAQEAGERLLDVPHNDVSASRFEEGVAHELTDCALAGCRSRLP